ncbi:MAG: hypothetical protein HY897_00070 [Deltaproteobacteria bacterium]|nr:hypothetical protein [Deltaproteobacteria bacterium]
MAEDQAKDPAATPPEEHLKADLQEMKYRPAVLTVAAFAAMFAFASVGSLVAGRAGHVLVIVAGLPLSLFTMPLLDAIEDPLVSALVLYGLNFVFGALFWFLTIVVATNFGLFLARRKLDYLLVVIVGVVLLCAFTFKELRGYGFFVGLEGKAAWKDGVPHKRVFATSTAAKGALVVGGRGWIAHQHEGKWMHFRVPGKSRKFPDSLVSLPDGRFFAKFGSDVYEISHTRWTRIPLKRASGALALSKNNELVLFSVEGVMLLRGVAFQPLGVAGDCVPDDRRVFVDSRGWVWSGGKLGNLACVYDGRNLHELKIKGADDDAPAGDAATAFAEDAAGVVWVGTEKGAVFRVSDGKAERLALPYPSGAGWLTSLLADEAGKFLATYSDGGMFVVDVLKNSVVGAELPGSDRLKHLCCLVRDGAGHVWVGTNKGLNRYR